MNERRESLFHRSCLPVLMCWAVLSYGVLAAMLLSDRAILDAVLLWIGLCTVPAVAFAIALPSALFADWLRAEPSLRAPVRRHLTPHAVYLEGRSS